MARGLEFRIKVVQGLYYLCSENNGADHDLHLNAYAKSWFSHDVAYLIMMYCILCNSFMKNLFMAISRPVRMYVLIFTFPLQVLI